jgi:glycosyltransferase involved in cell wall biosynthesis
MLSLTILTASLNHGQYIGEAVDSVVLRDGIRREHFVIDGDSTDETHAELARRPGLDLRIRPGLDSHEALNHGLSLATGDIIGVLNSDDRYEPGILDEVIDFFTANPDVEAAASTMRFFTGRGPAEREVGRTAHVPARDMLLEITFGNPGFNSWFFRRRMLDRLGGFRPHYRFSADRDLLLRLLAATSPGVLPQLGYHYRVHTESRTMDPRMTNRERITREHVRLAADHVRHVWQHDPAGQAVLRDWHAVEAFKLVLRTAGRPDRAWWDALTGTPWLHLPAGLRRRRDWQRRAAAGG